MSLTFYLESNLNKESQPKKKNKKQKKNLNLNLQLRNCLNQNWRQTRSRCYVEVALVCIVSAVYILFSGVDTGEEYGPKDNSYQETPRLPGRWGGGGALFQALSPQHREDLILQLRRQRLGKIKCACHPAGRARCLVFLMLKSVLESPRVSHPHGGKEADHELGFETCTKATTPGAREGLRHKMGRDRVGRWTGQPGTLTPE